MRFTLIAILAAGLMYVFLQVATSTPTVQFSHSTGECVRIITKDGVKPCDVIPIKYHHQWVY